LVAGWLIAHAEQFQVASVTFGGHRWTAHTGAWAVHPPATNTVEVNR
jgi:hypothetical protein